MPTQSELQEKFIQYTQRVDPIDYTSPTLRISVDSLYASASLYWTQRPGDYPSFISLSFTDSKDADEKRFIDWEDNPGLILSSIEVGENKDSEQRSPFDYIRAMLTILGTIMELSQQVGVLTHIVRANSSSRPFFDLLCKLGIYYTSDEVGIPVDEPKKWSSEYTLYACQYPNNALPDLSTYVPQDFLNALVKTYTDNISKMKNFNDSDEVFLR